MTELTVKEAFIRQGEACRSLGSSFLGQQCELCAEKLQSGGVVADRILNWQGDASALGDSVPLRLMGALHALARNGRAPELAAVYPPAHKTVSDDKLWRATSSALETHSEFILDRLQGPPQTNEVRRSAAILPLFLEVNRLTKLPLVISEVGASAGLNLFLDEFHIQLGDQFWGSPKSSVNLHPTWYGKPAPAGQLEIVSRAGCDLVPIDPGSEEDRERLMSYIWADQEERLTRTAAALQIAASADLRVEKADALDWLEHSLAIRRVGAAHVIFSTIAWQYLPDDARARGKEIIHAAGAQATTEAPIAWVAMEVDGGAPGAGLTMTLWPGGEQQTVGRADFHGRWIDWTGWVGEW